MPPKKPPKSSKAKSSAKSPDSDEVVDTRLVKALSHPLRARVLAILNSRIASPKELADKLDARLGNVSYHVNQLYKYGCIELVSEAPRRGATEHFYRGTTRSFLNDDNWAALAPEAKSGVSVAALKTQNEASLKALEADTFDSRANRHVSCVPMNADEQGWEDLMALLADSLERVIEIQGECASRLAKSGEQSFRVTISMLGFESPASER